MNFFDTFYDIDTPTVNHGQMPSKLSEWFGDGGKLPRKLKKKILGERMKRGKLRKLLDSVTIGEPIKTMYETPNISPYLFCPSCGETGYRGTGNMTSYPEHWERFTCLRCHNVVGYIDNSPFIHALECKEYNYNPVF